MNVNAYAAKQAIRIGMNVAGSVIARLLTKARPMSTFSPKIAVW